MITRNVELFKETVVKPWYCAMRHNQCIAYDVATGKNVPIQAIYLLTDGHVGARLAGEDDILRIEMTNYKVVDMRVSGTDLVIDSSKVYASFGCFLDEKPLFSISLSDDKPKDPFADSTYVAFTADAKSGKMTKLRQTVKRGNRKVTVRDIMAEACDKWAAMQSTTKPFYDKARYEPKGFNDRLSCKVKSLFVRTGSKVAEVMAF